MSHMSHMSHMIGSDHLVLQPFFTPDPTEARDDSYYQGYDRGAEDAYCAVAVWLDDERRLAEGMGQRERAAVLREALAVVSRVLPYR